MLRALFFATAIFFFFTLFFHSTSELNQDLGRHFITGKIILTSGKVPTTNLFSYTNTNFPFIDTHWLPGVFYYLADKVLGIPFLIWFSAILMGASLGLVLLVSFRYSRSLLATAVAFAVLSPVLLERTELRPEIFSYYFTAIFLTVVLYWSGIKEINRRGILLLFLLPVLEAVWVNSHIYFVIGPFLLSAVTANELFINKVNVLRGKISPKLKYLIYATGLTYMATLLNPNWLYGAVYPFTVFNNYGYTIVENQNIFFLQKTILNYNIYYFEAGAALFLLSFLLSKFKNISLLNIFLTGSIVLPVTAIRSFPFTFLLLLPVFAENLAIFWENLNSKKGFINENKSTIETAILSMVVLLTLVRTYRLASGEYYRSVDSPDRFGTAVRESGKPALDFVLSHNIGGPVFNNFDIGGYLDYRLYPGNPVFVDNRPEAYPAEFFRNVYIPMQMSPEAFSLVDKQYHFRVIIFTHNDGTPWAENFLSSIGGNPEWQLVYLDSYAAVWVKKASYPDIARDYAVTPEKLTDLSTGKYLDDLFLSKAGFMFGWNREALGILQKAYQENPDSITAMENLSRIYLSDQTTYPLGNAMLTKLRRKSSLILF